MFEDPYELASCYDDNTNHLSTTFPMIDYDRHKVLVPIVGQYAFLDS